MERRKCSLETLALINKDFWRGKKVFLTGHTGFKGSWLSFWLTELGAEVCGYSLPLSEENKLWKDLRLEKEIRSEHEDIFDLFKLSRIIKDFNPDIVIHMAAQALVSKGYTDPVLTFNTNVMGTVHLLQACQNVDQLKVCLNVTTDKVYDNTIKKAHKETDVLGGSDPYSASKACSELITKAWRLSFCDQEHSFKLATARSGNVIGGGDWAENRLIPDLIRAYQKNATLVVRHPKAVRPWQHVLDVLSGYLMYVEFLYQKNDCPITLNFSPGAEAIVSVEDMLALVKLKYPHVNSKYQTMTSDFKEEGTLVLDASEAHAKLHWKCRLDCQQMINLTLDWYEDFFKNSDARSITKKQIHHYMN